MKPCNKPDSSRRQFLNHLAVASASLPIVVLLGGTRTARAEDAPHMDPEDPMAKALRYVHDAVASEGREDVTALCDNCMHYSGESGKEWGPCALFQGKQVNAKGWCTAWIKKA
ncbi:MAG TPA: high-potential iron-sulfur protein [Xanthomonadales bacterium]